jgi:hypothetical protein
MRVSCTTTSLSFTCHRSTLSDPQPRRIQVQRTRLAPRRDQRPNLSLLRLPRRLAEQRQLQRVFDRFL